jgi:hypothetical protein
MSVEGAAMSEDATHAAKPDAKPQSGSKHPLVGALKGLIQIPPGLDPVQPADPDWSKQG